MEKQPKAKRRIPAQVPQRFARSAEQAHSDVLGSYTGNPLYDDQPVQDADDL